MRALRRFYYGLGDRIWREYGFLDAFSEAADWYANSHLAIDQGPIVVMIENARTGLLWHLFMSCPEIRRGLNRLGFPSPHLGAGPVSCSPTYRGAVQFMRAPTVMRRLQRPGIGDHRPRRRLRRLRLQGRLRDDPRA